jgi:sulfite exporter TauE/SafE
LYAFALIAAGTGSAAWGAAIMAAFWLGTVPVLASVGAGVQALTGTLGRRLPLVTAVAIVLLGLYTLAGRAVMPAGAFEHRIPWSSNADTQEKLDALGHSEPPCCPPKE